MKDVALPACKDWSFKTERGDTIKGFYYVPANFDPNKKYPMIVYYYGGCTPTTKQLEYVYPVADFANQGYVAYVVEPSGAIGFGQEFAAGLASFNEAKNISLALWSVCPVKKRRGCASL